MLEYPIYLKLTFFLLFVIIIGPKMIIPGLQLLIVKLQIIITKLEYLFLMAIVSVYKLFTKRSLNVGLFKHVNHALVATYSDDSGKCVTAIGHRAFNEENLLIVEEYDNEETARTGHKNWVKTFEKMLPRELKDVTNNKVYKRELFE
ncbi:MAG: hypothetical protein ABSC11_10360 [Smithella sp.]|jgi:hypothetical protein